MGIAVVEDCLADELEFHPARYFFDFFPQVYQILLSAFLIVDQIYDVCSQSVVESD